MRTVVTSRIVHRCPHVDEFDVGEIVLTFDGEAPELHNLAAGLRLFEDVKITHEDLTAHVAEQWAADVVTRWTTAGLDVECHAP